MPIVLRGGGANLLTKYGVFTDNFVSSHLARFHSILVHAIWPKEAVKRSSTKVRKLHEVMCKAKSLLQSSGVVDESRRFVL